MSHAIQILETLYSALQRRDHQAMAALYHPEATFEDEVFQLKGAEIGKMWHMLCARGQDLELRWSGLSTLPDGRARGRWEPTYTFSKTGRKVHNRIETEVELRDGLIWRQQDRFDFWRWSRQALGLPGWLLGWTPLLRRQVAQQANATLARFSP